MQQGGCATCGSTISNTAVTGIFCDTCHTGATGSTGSTYLRGPASVGAFVGAVPFFVHVTVNGLDYVALGCGAIALMFGVIGIAGALRQAEGRATRLGMGFAVLALGLLQLFRSGILT